ncbi:hypothetical protein CBR_g12422 [Chara braunii]|uniref:protein-S-isoprenylcysteine alpha-carbonyl methylesterase n=1 Tax=Chara braunii TaxID=69332 RepID=A0A388JSA9_CHABU|nr:hypothetical protein CBR_g12422 [Chara braunii]|eukprot:GBG60686.1 hypothetical protein CBR_g12422 [Chara braunii]
MSSSLASRFHHLFSSSMVMRKGRGDSSIRLPLQACDARGSVIFSSLITHSKPFRSVQEVSQMGPEQESSSQQQVEVQALSAPRVHGEDVPLVHPSHHLCGEQHARRRLFMGPGSLHEPMNKRFTREVEHAASETFLVTHLTFKLLRFLGLGYKWMIKFAALMAYTTCLLPGFLQVAWFYLMSTSVHRSIVYGEQPRNRLDVYLPPEMVSVPLAQAKEREGEEGSGLSAQTNGGEGEGEGEGEGKPRERRPVVVFVTGGAWIIGYKAWGALLGRTLSERGVVVACLDYRNFPQGRINDMVDDVTTGIGWVLNNARVMGGDPSLVFLVGQSAGAHLGMLSILRQAICEATTGAENLLWRSSDLRGFVGLSGPYDIVNLVEHFHKRGLYRRIFLPLMEGKDQVHLHSPSDIVRNSVFRRNGYSAASFFPPVTLLHGTEDASVPCTVTTEFADTLQSIGVHARTRLYPGKTHTDPIIEDPMRGGEDELVEDILQIVYEGKEQNVAQLSIRRRCMVPDILLRLARFFSPF